MTLLSDSKGHYSPATNRDSDQDLIESEIATIKAPWREATKCANMILGILVALNLAVLLLLLVTQRKMAIRSFEPRSCACGSSAVEAIANGCKFDFFGMVWLPDHCRDDDLIEIFEDFGKKQHHNWTLFNHPNATHQLGVEDAASLAGDPYSDPGMIMTTRDWHDTHCLYVLLQHFRSDITHLGIAKRYRSQQHAQHCVEALLKIVSSEFWSSAPSGISEVDVYIE